MMDGLRGAFANVDFEDGYLKHGLVLPVGGGADQMKRSAAGVSNKMNVNSDVFPDGFATTNASWVNNLIAGANAQFFQWQGKASGVGINALTSSIADTKAFPRCMVRRVYRSVCKRESSEFEDALLNQIADEFSANNFNLKWLFKKVAVNPACLGE